MKAALLLVPAASLCSLPKLVAPEHNADEQKSLFGGVRRAFNARNNAGTPSHSLLCLLLLQ